MGPATTIQWGPVDSRDGTTASLPLRVGLATEVPAEKDHDRGELGRHGAGGRSVALKRREDKPALDLLDSDYPR